MEKQKHTRFHTQVAASSVNPPFPYTMHGTDLDDTTQYGGRAIEESNFFTNTRQVKYASGLGILLLFTHRTLINLPARKATSADGDSTLQLCLIKTTSDCQSGVFFVVAICQNTVTLRNRRKQNSMKRLKNLAVFNRVQMFGK